MKDKQKLLDILNKHKPFNEDIQKKVGRDRAVVYAIYLIESNNLEATFQRICVVSFKLFPESFSFPEFSEYPDSRTVRYCITHCMDKSKGWVIGSSKTTFNLTEKGREVSQIFLNLIERDMNVKTLPHYMQLRGKTKKELATKPRDKEINILTEIKESEGYLKFINDKGENIKSIDVRKSLGGDRYSPLSYINDKLTEFLKYSKIYKEKDVDLYLKWIKNNWSRLMGD